MKRILLSFCLIIFLGNAFSQEQITDFENVLESSPNNISYKATISNRIIFTAFTPETGTELWVSDGTKEGTKLLKEFTDGKESSNFYTFKVHQNWLYFSAGVDYWKTNGVIVEKDSRKVIDSLYRILGYYEKYPIVASNWKVTWGSYPYTQYTSYQLAIVKNQNDSVNISERPIFSHIILEDKIYYNTYNHKDSIWTFNCYANGKSQLIHSEKQLQMPESMAFMKHNDFLYFKISLNKVNYSSIAAIPNYQCLIQLKDSSATDYKIQKFEGNVLLKTNETLSYFFHQKANKLEVFQLETFRLLDSFTLNQANCSGYGSVYKSIDYTATKLSYIVTNGSFLDYSCVFLYEHDSMKGNVKRSSNLIKIFSTSISNLEVQSISDSQYYISSVSYLTNTPSKKIIYNLSDNSWENIENQPVIKQDTIQLSDKKIIVSVYDVRLENGVSVLNKNYYRTSSQEGIRTYLLKDKIILLRYLYGKTQHELYASDGDKSFDFLGIVKGEFQNFYDAKELDGKLFFYLSTKNGNFYLYQTDGTKENTKLLYENTKSDYVYVSDFVKNDNQIALKITESVESVIKENYLLIIEGGNIRKVYSPINLANYTISSKGDAFLLFPNFEYHKPYNIYKIENDSLKISPQKIYNSPYQFKKRLYYLKPLQNFNGVYYLDKDLKEYPFLNFNSNVYNLYIQENIMVLSQRASEQRMTVIIVDLETEKEVLRFETDNYYSLNVLKNKQSLLIQFRREAVIIDLLKKTKQSFEISQDEQTEIFGEGFLVYNFNSINFKLTYFDLNLTAPIKIIDHKPRTNYYKNQSQSYLLFSEIVDNRLFWRCFFPKTNTIITQTETSFDEVSRFTQHGLIGLYNNKNYYYKLENSQFIKKFEINPNNLVNIDSNDYLVPGAISELAELTKDSIIYFPRIEKGTTQASVFHFKENVYVLADAPSKGLQIWKMGKIREQDIVLEKEEENRIFIQVFPNPATEKLRIECELPSKVSLINSTGKILSEDFLQQKELDVQHLPTGMYLLKFQNEKGIFTRRFMKY